MKNLRTHQTTAPEDTIFQISLALLEEIGYAGEIHRNVEIPLDGIAFVPDLYIPQLGLVISVDGRIHEHGYENEWLRRRQLLDGAKDYIFKRAGIDILVVHNYETVNRSSLAVRLRNILSVLVSNPPTTRQLNKTKKTICRGRRDLSLKYSERFSSRKVGTAGIQFGRTIYHHYFGFKVLLRKKKRLPEESNHFVIPSRK